MRIYSNISKDNEFIIRNSLNTLTIQDVSVEDYRKSFEELGIQLGKIISDEITNISSDNIMIACATEDTDWLAKGIQTGLCTPNAPISVFWSDRVLLYKDKKGNKIEISPIIKSYEEPIDNCKTLIIVKSIINTSCVIKTQLLRLIEKLKPEQIIIAAPVMYKDAQSNLRKEFPESISSKFKFFTFAIDDECKDGQVIPGIGGMVYSRLGINDVKHFMPSTLSRKI